MSLRFDEKGMFFTEIVSKEAVEVIIQTPTNQLRGNIHIRPGERLRDEINESETFLAITEVIIYDLDHQEQYHCDFLALNREHIIWMLPCDRMSQPSNHSGGDVE
jgi:hypothetical protein